MKRVKKHYMSIWGLVLALVVILPAQARAELFGFTRITANTSGPEGTAIAAQLCVDVTDPGGGQVSFKFYNDGPAPYNVPDIASSITDIYFDDGTLLGIASIVEGSGVAFSNPAAPADLPGGNLVSPAFVTTGVFSADSDATGGGVMANGVNQGEYVEILFNLVTGKTFAETLAALYSGINTPEAPGNLRIGVHVQSIGGTGGTSDSFIMTPVPGAVILGLLGLGVAGWKLRKFA